MIIIGYGHTHLVRLESSSYNGGHTEEDAMSKKIEDLEQEEEALARAVRSSAQQIWQAGLGAFAKAQAEGGKVFGEGSQTGVAIALLVKARDHVGPARVHYRDIGDHLPREAKLGRLRAEASIAGTDFTQVSTNEAGDWINQRDERFGEFQPLGDKATKGKAATPAAFREFSNGLKTNRDAWAFNFSLSTLKTNIRTHVDHLNAERERIHSLIAQGAKGTPESLLERDSTLGSWSRPNVADLRRNRPTLLDSDGFRVAIYRPFMRAHVYFDRTARLNEMIYLTPRIWPTPAHENFAIGISTDARVDSPPLLVRWLPSLDFTASTQLFPRYTWEPATAPDGALNLDALAASDSDEVVDGYRRVDNITDATLDAYRKVHGDAVTKDDIFYGIYALLHHPAYRETYAADLQKMLPRIPQVKDFLEYARIGRDLADLHVDYESVPQADLGEQITSIDPPTDPYELYRIDKLAWISRKDHTAIRYNAHLTITGIPLEESEYKVGGRSPLEWVLDRYMVKVDKASGIVNDPNAWLREQENPRYVVELIRSLVTVSIQTQRLIAQLPAFEVIEP